MNELMKAVADIHKLFAYRNKNC